MNTTQEIESLLLTIYTPEQVQQFMCTPQKLLDGSMPIRLIAEGKQQEVLNVVRRLVDLTYL